MLAFPGGAKSRAIRRRILIELCLNRDLEMQFKNKTLEEYWSSAIVSFAGLCEAALAVFIQFATIWLRKELALLAN